MNERRVHWDVEAYVARSRAACFVCELLSGAEGYEHEIIHRDASAVVFLAKYPNLRGHLLVAPVEHREHVVSDFTAAAYLDLQRVIHRACRALQSVVTTERLYITSLGSQQGNRHVHWHLLPLPPGVPYADQQMGVFAEEHGWLQLDPADTATLADELRVAWSGEVALDRGADRFT